ncbi:MULTISPECIES: ABC transporter substrate-binding protein [Streptomyces]|uniref:Probable sugar-binding periplasmic protein n=1 Tax=Streptomyces venezuelae TaxID=54571 RepID=A0A5P2BAW0_STRVZ|nr:MULTISPECIES: ABC transporter substrate-binding protein [Streptomyces]NEA02531.1 ABC transporter substrate-binding protein [Streptomyces sp. SID10116]MYY80936.1 extracellular solute-binding protein [Streptomyces sp. SID335]MYZ15827.1 extracellular solute-binding protein [Streptomyces sp. SID337]NDZ86121.1 ABC transporter substrate-binding protein [Streptomyces sp. SID10115]NEB48144.1 ABC transporter substrate-binding protein [Streptomyces sp. SID339]
MPRWRMPTCASAALAAAGLLLSGCANPSVGSANDDPTKPVTLKFWHGWATPGEVKAVNDSIDRFEKLHPNITVKATGNVSDETINQALRAGGDKAPDVVSSFTTNNVGQYCDSGMWVDLDPFMKKTGLDKHKTFPKTLLDYTSYRGNQCALPLLADAFGMYYNKDAFDEAGIERPPRTMSEFEKAAKKLTVRSGKGSYKRVGFMPNFRFYQNSPDRLFAQWGPEYFDADGDSRLADEPSTYKFFKTATRLADAQGGFDDLERFRMTFGDEMSSQNAFLTQKVAMHLDGEWRGLMLKDAKAEFNWDVAPLPVPDDQADTYGRGFITGTVAGIAHSSKHQNAAWELVRFLTADTKQVVNFANAIHNVPSTFAALKSPDLDADPTFRTFFDILENKHSKALPPSVNGGAYVVSLGDFAYGVEAGRVSDLRKGLKKLDEQIDADTLQSKS